MLRRYQSRAWITPADTEVIAQCGLSPVRPRHRQAWPDTNDPSHRFAGWTPHRIALISLLAISHLVVPIPTFNGSTRGCRITPRDVVTSYQNQLLVCHLSACIDTGTLSSSCLGDSVAKSDEYCAVRLAQSRAIPNARPQNPHRQAGQQRRSDFGRHRIANPQRRLSRARVPQRQHARRSGRGL